MESERKQILESVLEDIKCISDKCYQERIWIRGDGPECDDFDETACHFLPNGRGIIDHYKDFGLTNEQYHRLVEFMHEFELFCQRPARENSLPLLFINTPAWAKIIKMAKELYEFLDINEIEPRINPEPISG